MALTKITSTNIQPGAIESSSLETSGATAGTYGAAAKIPVLSVNAQGIVYAISEVDVAGVTGFTFDTGSEELTISTADGNSFTADVTYFASKAYADQAETDAISTANAYTDTRETAITTAYESYTDTALTNLLDGAPAALDTLNELAAAINDDASYAATVTASLATKVDKINITGATVGSASQVPVITFNAQGQITSATTTAVAGVSSTAYNTTTGVLTINTSDGGSFTNDLGIGTADNPRFNNLGVNGGAGTNGRSLYVGGDIEASTNIYAQSFYDLNNPAYYTNPAGQSVLLNVSIEGVLNSTVATGTAPLTVASSTKVTNLNADFLDGLDAVQFLRSDQTGTLSGNLTTTGSITSGSSVTIGSSGQYVAGSLYADSNWGMIFRAKTANPSNADFLWSDSTDTHLMALKSGYLGIGTTSPQVKLDVVGTIKASDRINVGSYAGVKSTTDAIVGDTYYDSTGETLRFWNGSNWVATNLIPNINSISGTIVYGISTTLTLNITNATPEVTVVYKNSSGTEITRTTGVSISNSSCSTVVPSSVYAQAYQSTVSISVLNADSTPSNTINTTVDAYLGTIIANPASSAAAIKTDWPSAPDGWYYLNTGSGTFGCYIRFNWHMSRHWYCVMLTTGRSTFPSGSSYWTNSTLYNENDSNITGGTHSKFAAWNNISMNYVLMDMNGVVPAIMYFSTARTMYSAMQNNAAGAFGGLGCQSTTPSFSQVGYNGSGFYYSGGPFGAQTGRETIVQQYGINCFANNSTNANPDNAGLASTGRAGARVGTPLDEQGHTFNNASNSGADSGFGFGYCGGNAGRTGSCGYAEWSSAAVVEISPGRLWVS